MKLWFLILWGFSGPHVHGVFTSVEACDAQAREIARLRDLVARYQQS